MNKQFIGFSALAVVAGLVLLAGCSAAAAPSRVSMGPDGNARVFEMRTYITHPGKLTDLERRFRDHTVRLFEKHGITNVGYWVPQDSTGDHTLVYMLAYPTRADADRMWAAFRADPDWVAARTASEANGPIVQRVISVFMDPTDFSNIR